MEWLCWWLYPQDSFTISHYLCFAIVWLWLLVWRLRPHSLGHNNHLLDCNWRPHLNKHNTDIMYQTPHKSNFKSSFMVKLNYFALQMTCFHCSLVKQIGSDESLYERKVSDWLFWLLYLWCGVERGEEVDDQHSSEALRGLSALANQRPVLTNQRLPSLRLQAMRVLPFQAESVRVT